jgi:GT2 family glycosyltransferase
MTRPAVSVVMPFAGIATDASEALATLRRLDTREGDELILADNSWVARSDPVVHVIHATWERSPAHARNVGAEHGTGEWILFLDADCRTPRDLLDTYFATPVAGDVGALAGEVVPAGDAATLAERYGAARSFLRQRAQLAHPYLPRAVAANLMVRREAFEQVGGFFEGVRAAEDTDFSWRLQRAGWRLELRPEAMVEHRYRATLRELRGQWRGYAAGRAWLRRRYEGFEPEPALRRGLSRASGRVRRPTGTAGEPAASSGAGPGSEVGRLDRARYFALDALLGVEELAGFALSNRPERAAHDRSGRVVLVADRFPVRGDPLVDFARTLHQARVEARARPESPWLEAGRELEIAYREDEGLAARAFALARLVTRHPVRSARDVWRRGPGQPALSALAPAAVRLEGERGAQVHPLGGDDVRVTAGRLAALAGRKLADPRWS